MGDKQVLGRDTHSELGRGPSTPVCSFRPTHGLLEQTLLSEDFGLSKDKNGISRREKNVFNS